MSFCQSLQWKVLALLLAFMLMAGVVFGWLCWRSPAIRFLPPSERAQWILYPAPAHIGVQIAGSRPAVFRRRFELSQIPPSARVQVRGFQQVALAVNQQAVAVPAPGNWKIAAEVDIGRYLQNGRNEIQATVTNDTGQPCLWFFWAAGDWSLSSDEQWSVSVAGAPETAAASATLAPPMRPGNPVLDREQTVPSLRSRAGTLLVFGLLIAAAWTFFRWAQRRRRLWGNKAHRISPATMALIMIGLVWGALFLNNLPELIFPLGFDGQPHREYVEYVFNNLFTDHPLPLASDGWEMHQPPLYYIQSALALRILRASPAEPAAMLILRTIHFATAIINLALIAGCLRLTFPENPRRQVLGLIVAGFLPMYLYISQYGTNDLLASTLASAAIYITLRVLRDRSESILWLAGLGLALGAAMLAKVIVAGLVPAIFALLAGKLLVERSSKIRSWLLVVGLPALVMVATCGWHFYRVWAHFGNPLIGSYDPGSGFAWWQDPGFSTVPFLTRFGQVLVEPYFAGIQSFPDGIYATLWGDGMWGGAAGPASRPPWNYDLMAAGYLLALLPSLAIVLGGTAALVQLLRQPSREVFLLLGVVFFVALSMLYHFLRLPYYCHIKAVYGLGALAPLAALAAWGLDLLTARGSWLRAPVEIALGVWALTALASFWVPGQTTDTQVWVGQNLVEQRQLKAAIQQFETALENDPNNNNALLGLGIAYGKAGNSRKASALFRKVTVSDPENYHGHFFLGLALANLGQNAEAIEELQTVRRLAPDHFLLHAYLGRFLAKANRYDDAIDILRRGLAVRPGEGELHYQLGSAYAVKGDIAGAIRSYRQALATGSDWPPALDKLARLLATQADARYRDGRQALRLANLACEKTKFEDVNYLDTLAAAQAEVGEFALANVTLQQAIDKARAAGRRDIIVELENRARLYRAGKPYREEGTGGQIQNPKP
jgi:tetratricopeptide (TPR) repeat protein